MNAQSIGSGQPPPGGERGHFGGTMKDTKAMIEAGWSGREGALPGWWGSGPDRITVMESSGDQVLIYYYKDGEVWQRNKRGEAGF